MTSKILGLGGSIRSNFKAISALQTILNSASSEKEIASRISQSGYRFANSEVALAMALFSARQKGAEVVLHSIANIFNRSEKNIISATNLNQEQVENIDFLSINQEALEKLFKILMDCTGIILSSPVYFGDRSSTANKFMQLTNNKRLLKNKVFGMISVGAKRNGGQETTCIYGLYDAMMQGAVVVGNGPKTSQYGGTIVAGDMMACLDDEWGMQRCLELGRRVCSMSKILNAGLAKPRRRKLHITALMTMDTPNKKFKPFVEEYFQEVSSECDVQYVDLIDYEIFRCIACDVCPPSKIPQINKYFYKCVIQNSRDSMKSIIEKICGCDCLVIVGVNSYDKLIYNYQAFTERTRSVRRNDFMFNNMTVIGMLINEMGAINNPLHNQKVLTSYVRHNTQLLKPIEAVIFEDGSKRFNSQFSDQLFLLSAITSGREQVPPEEISYKATGYVNKNLDYTSKVRR